MLPGRRRGAGERPWSVGGAATVVGVAPCRHYNLDGMDSGAKADDDATCLVSNPAKRAATAAVSEVKAALAAAHDAEGPAALAGGRTKADANEIAAAFARAAAELAPAPGRGEGRAGQGPPRPAPPRFRHA